jgi:hypothetical protein
MIEAEHLKSDVEDFEDTAGGRPCEVDIIEAVKRTGIRSRLLGFISLSDGGSSVKAVR